MVGKVVMRLSVRTLKTMAKQGIGHGRLYEVALSLQKKSKKVKNNLDISK